MGLSYEAVSFSFFLSCYDSSKAKWHFLANPEREPSWAYTDCT